MNVVFLSHLVWRQYLLSQEAHGDEDKSLGNLLKDPACSSVLSYGFLNDTKLKTGRLLLVDKSGDATVTTDHETCFMLCLNGDRVATERKDNGNDPLKKIFNLAGFVSSH